MGSHQVYWSENWENGQGFWNPTAGVWQVGAPTYGTTTKFGANCATTGLTGNYPYGTSSRLESPSFTLPASPADGVLWLGFWHFFNCATAWGSDYGVMQIWTQAQGWVEVSQQFGQYSSNWTPYYVDISAYAGQTIKIGLYFGDVHDNGSGVQAPGWYVDQLSIFDGSFPDLVTINTLEKAPAMDWDGWFPDRGVWELGEPKQGVARAHSGKKCFGTNFTSGYPQGANSRLTGPYVTLPASPKDGKLWFSFNEYCSFQSSWGTDTGYVQINNGSGWVNLGSSAWPNNFGNQWTERLYDVSAYAGQKVRFAFVMYDVSVNGSAVTSLGWYIDDLRFSEGARFGCGNPERFESYTPDWTTVSGVWEAGVPTSGPAAAHSGTKCWGTNIDGNYQANLSDLLSTPPITLPNTAGLYVRFWHWYSFATFWGADFGVVRIKPEGGTWTDITNHFTGSAGAVWTQFTYDLSAYAGQTVQFGFFMQDYTDNGSVYTAPGWYVDDFEIIGMPQAEAPMKPFFLDVAISAGSPELNFTHMVGPNIEKVVIYSSPAENFLPSIGTRRAVLPGTATSFTDTEQSGWPATYYRVSIVDNLGNESEPILATHISAVPGDELPVATSRLSLNNVSPNPFNPTTYISFNLPKATTVDVAVYDLRGRKVADLLHASLEAGPHKVPFTPDNLASGTYFARVSADGHTESKKMLLVK